MERSAVPPFERRYETSPAVLPSLRNLARIQIAAGGGSFLALALLAAARFWSRPAGAWLATFFLLAALAFGLLGVLATLFAVLKSSFDTLPLSIRLPVFLSSLLGVAVPLLGTLLGLWVELRGLALLALFGALSLTAGIGVQRRADWAPAAEIVFSLFFLVGALALVADVGSPAELGPLLLIGLLSSPFALLALVAGTIAAPPAPPLGPGPRRSSCVGPTTSRAKGERGFLLASRGIVALAFLLWFLLILAQPNLHEAIARKPQRMTLADLRVIAISVEAWAVDHGAYPDVRTLDELEALVAPTYIRHLPRVDGWGWPIEYYPIDLPAAPGSVSSATPKPPGPQGYVIRSPGRDGTFELADPTAYPNRPVEGFERDLVFASGSGSQWPVGTMGP